jgi:glycosyltransferase involved in cell wall biosynthesis
VASRITKEKNISLAIRAFDLLIKSGKDDTGLIIVGDGPEKDRLISLSEKLNIKDKVIFLGWASKNELYSMYKTSDIFLNTSFFEGYGMSMVEAKIAGLHIVSTDVGVARDIGATICDYNPSDLSKTLSDILI